MSEPEASAYRVELVIDGQPVSLKPFLHGLLGGGVVGLVEGLRGIDRPDRVELVVQRIDDPDSSDSLS